MVYLRLNGLPVPVEDGGASLRISPIGEVMRAIDGTLRMSRSDTKRTWRITTPRMSPRDAQTLEEVVRGRGESWNFDAHVYSTKGLAPSTGRYTIQRSVAVDGLTVKDDAKVAGIGRGAVSLDPASTNILAANQRGVETDTSGFTSRDGATLTRDTTYKWQGAASLKVVTSGAINGTRGGVDTNNAAAASTARHHASAYLMSTASVSVRMHLYNATSGTPGGIVTTALTAYEWTRVVVSLSGVTSGDNLQIRIDEATADSAITFYVDGLQIEASAGTGYQHTAWVNGARAQDDQLVYPVSFMSDWDCLTLNFWVTRPLSEVTNTHGICDFYDNDNTAQNRLTVSAVSGVSDTLRVRSISKTGTVVDSEITGFFTDGWQMVTIVWINNPRTGESRLVIFKDASPVALSPAPTESIDFSKIDRMSIGGTSAGQSLNALLDDFLVVPYPASALVTTYWWVLSTSGRTVAGLPLVDVGGDVVPGVSLICQAMPEPSRFAPYSDAGVWQDRARSVSFTLEEA